MHAAARRALRAVAILLGCLALAACVGHAFPWQDQDYYTVRRGDTLYSIAFDNGLDYRDVARWNGITDPARIYPGQVLKLYPPSGTTTAKTAPARPPAAKAPDPKPTPPPATRTPPPRPPSAVAWQWPASGTLAARFGDTGSTAKGIDIAGRQGDAVAAAAAGHVVYAGSGLIGYGKLVIIKHDDTFLSAYGYNDELLVAQGAQVRAGERIATMGMGSGKRAMLHFEIRIDGKPVDPLLYLPPR
jgi:lipoprotein NlpD